MKQLAIFGKKNKKGLGFTDQENKALNYTILVWLEAVYQFIKENTNEKFKEQWTDLSQKLAEAKNKEIYNNYPVGSTKGEKEIKEKKQAIKQATDKLKTLFISVNFLNQKVVEKNKNFYKIQSSYVKRGIDFLPLSIVFDQEKVSFAFQTFSSKIYYYNIENALIGYRRLHGASKGFSPLKTKENQAACLTDKNAQLLKKFTAGKENRKTSQFFHAKNSGGIMATNSHILLQLPCNIAEGKYDFEGNKLADAADLLDYDSYKYIFDNLNYHYVIDIEKVKKFVKIPTKESGDNYLYQKNLEQRSVFKFGKGKFIAFNNRYLLVVLDAMKQLGGSYAHIYLNASNRAVLFSPQEKNNTNVPYAVIMPVMMNNYDGFNITEKDVKDVQTYDLAYETYENERKITKIQTPKPSHHSDYLKTAKPKPRKKMRSRSALRREKKAMAWKKMNANVIGVSKATKENTAPKAKVSPKAKVAKAKGAKSPQKATTAPKSAGSVPFGNAVENKAIESFYGMINQKITFAKLFTFISTFQKNAKAGKIRKDSPVYPLLSSIFNIAKKANNAAVNKTNLLTLSVGKDVSAQIEKMLVYAIEKGGLKGVEEDDEDDLDGLGCACETPSLNGTRKSKKKSLGVIPANELSLDSMKDKLPLKSDWLPIFGKPTKGFKALVFGKAGSGKTTMLLDFAKDFAGIGKVLYVTGEQSKVRNGELEIADTFVERAFSRSANVKNIEVAASLPKNLSQYDLVILDSVQALEMKPSDLDAIAEKYPELSIIIVSQINKRGNYKGTTAWAHNPDIIIELPSYGIAEATKNRFGTLGTLEFDKN